MNQEISRNDLKNQIKEIRSTNSEIKQKAIIYAIIYQDTKFLKRTVTVTTQFLQNSRQFEVNGYEYNMESISALNDNLLEQQGVQIKNYEVSF